MVGMQLVFRIEEQQVFDLEVRTHKHKQVISHHAKGSVRHLHRTAPYSNELII